MEIIKSSYNYRFEFDFMRRLIGHVDNEINDGNMDQIRRIC